jgi:hypothetical protein
MAQGKRVEVSAAQRTEIWRRWKARESLHEIGRAFGRLPCSGIRLGEGIVSSNNRTRRKPRALRSPQTKDFRDLRAVACATLRKEY